MSQVIPGGRPRASSDGDILDEGLCGPLFVNLNDRRNDEYRKNYGKVVHVNINSNNGNRNTNCLDLSTDAFDSDGEVSSQSQSSFGTSRRIKFLKSMRKAVSRAFVKDASSSKNESTLKKADKLRACNLSRIWTPDLRHLTELTHGKVVSSDENSDLGTMSSNRPLITDPSIGMTSPRWKVTPGTIGIFNHDNSCFMNAVLQCLSNTDSFTEYFVKDFFKNDLKNNKNGKKGVFRSNHGEVTEQLARLLKSLWSGKYTSEISKEFKSVVGKVNAQYKGDHQHDAQEFLLWLLDRIHEDVCVFSKRKTKLPKLPVEKSDEELAIEAASVNGESFVLKLFQALHSSTLICTTCGERSSTFDPYLCVSLPLPQRCPRLVNVVVVPLKRGRTMKYTVILNQFDSVKDLRERIASEAKLAASQLLLVQMKEDGFGSTYGDEQPLNDVADSDLLYAIEMYSNDTSMNSSVQEFETPTAQIVVTHVETFAGSGRNSRFSSPMLIKVRRDITWKELQKAILLALEDSVHKEIFGQKLSLLFQLRVYDGSSHKVYLPSDVEMPLYTQIVESAYTELENEFDQPHIKLVAEWDSTTKKSVIKDDREHIELHPSVVEAQNSLPTQGKVTLEECFKLYTQEEKLIGDDAWLCPHCKQQQQGTIKTLGLWSLPDILVLHLKRFKQSGQRRSKLMTLVDFPVDNLDMSGHLSQREGLRAPLKRDNYIYDLLGVSNHYGNMMGGHYTAYCRSPVDGVWREFNDNKVTNLEGPIATKEAYLLFYQRKSLTKDINQKMFTGDHWVFSLSLAPSLEAEPNLANEVISKTADSVNHTKRSRSRSVSPSSRKQNRDVSVATKSQPLTPQPPRHPVLTFSNGVDHDTDSSPDSPNSPPSFSLTNRMSRPLQRQVTESHFKRERSAGAIPSNTSKRDLKKDRPLLSRRSIEDDINGLDYNRNNTKYDFTNGETGQKRSRVNDKPQVTVIRHEKSSTLPNSLSKTNGYVALDSDAKYPSSYSDGSYLSSSFEPPSILRVRLEETENQYSRYAESEEARRKLAQLIKSSSIDRSTEDRYLASIDTIEEETSAKTRNLKKLNLPKQNLKDVTHLLNSDVGSRLDYDRDEERDTILFSGSHYNNYDDLNKWKSARTNVLQQSSRLSDQKKFQKLAQQHFGSNNDRPYDKEKYRARFSDDTTFRDSDDLETGYDALTKYATLGRKQDISDRGRLEKDAIPRSSTDYGIQYSVINPQPPPSPTPPHTLREERTISSSGLSSLPSSTSDYFSSSRLTEKEVNSLSSYEFHGRPPLDQRAVAHTLPIKQEKNRFRPPRGIWGTIKSKPSSTLVSNLSSTNVGNLPTPCLRESSV
nr:ubiquitin carboxyl-terminal hydrolase 31-like isoform X1 [Biomphalaria glabrata]